MIFLSERSSCSLPSSKLFQTVYKDFMDQRVGRFLALDLGLYIFVLLIVA